ncbi:MAG TPA: Crp/Fnr family transcriptional regulator [Rhizobiaceae bacterium]|nr:Crp/Fnr family transcriptional regulator [Rhizobiaceae bacterium]
MTKDIPVFQRYGSAIGILIGEGRFEQRLYRAGETIVIQGDEETRAFIVKGGWGCISRCLHGGQRQLIELSLAGDVVDFSFGATGGQEEFSALTDMIVWEGPSARMGVLDRSDAVVRRFLADAARRRRAILVERLANLALRDASARIAHFLLEIGTRLCLAGFPARDGYQCPLVQQDVADALGMTPIHVNRMLREARALNLYDFRRGRVEFLNYTDTVAFADFDCGFLNWGNVAQCRRDVARTDAARLENRRC